MRRFYRHRFNPKQATAKESTNSPAAVPFGDDGRMNYLWLAIAIVSEVIGTSSLKACAGFTRLWPSIIVVLSYSTTFYFFSLTLKTIPVGIAYAIWAGVGIVLVALIGFFFFRQKLDAPALVGMGLIIAGTVLINFFSKSTHN